MYEYVVEINLANAYFYSIWTKQSNLLGHIFLVGKPMKLLTLLMYVCMPNQLQILIQMQQVTYHKQLTSTKYMFIKTLTLIPLTITSSVCCTVVHS